MEPQFVNQGLGVLSVVTGAGHIISTGQRRVFSFGAQLQVEICESSLCDTSTIASFTTTTGPGSETVRVNDLDEYYIVNWHTDEFGLDPAKTYRISIFA